MSKKSFFSILLLLTYGSIFAQTHWEEDLNSGLPSGWTINDGGNSSATWEHVDDYKGNTLDGSPFLEVSSDSAGGGDTLVETIVTPSANTSSSENLYIGFDQHFDNSSQERAYVDVWDGSTWQQVKSYGSPKGSWVSPHRAEIDISTYRNPNLKVRFRYEDNAVWGQFWAIDNIKLWNKRCFDPSNLRTSKIEVNSSYVTWDSKYPNNAKWQVIFVQQGLPLNQGDTITTNNDTTAIGPLNANTEYEFYVREICITGDTTAFVGPYTFRTRCQTSILPYEETMESFTVNDDATGYECWVPDPTNSISPYRWNTDDGGTPSSSTGPAVDHTTGSSSGIYAYTEASDGAAGDVATLSSSKIDLSNTSHPIMTFWYHRYGNDMGELHVDVSTDQGKTWHKDVTQPLLGEQQSSEFDAWKEKYVDLSSYRGDVITVRFRAISDGGFNGDMAIDDISVQEASDTDLKVQAMPSPSKPGCYSNNHPVELLVVNGGLDSIDITQTNIDLTVEVTGAVNQTLNTTVTDNSLNGGDPLGTLDSIVVPMGNVNMGSLGFYDFKGYANSISGDTIPINDSIVKTIDVQNQSGGTVSGGGEICIGDTANLKVTNHFGTVQWQMNDGGAWMDIPATGNDSTTLKAAPQDTTLYRVEVCGSSLSSTDTVMINDITPPTVKNDTFCKGFEDQAQLEAQGSGKFFWYKEQGSSDYSDTGKSKNVNVQYTDVTYWVSRADSIAADPIVITEIDHGFNDGVEIQNVSSGAVDVSGWTVAVNDYINIDTWNNDADHRWDLTGTMNPGEIKVGDENGTQIDVGWISNPEGWVMILDENGNMVDWAPFGWSQTEIQNFNATVAGSNVSSKNSWSGPAMTSCGSGENFQRIGDSDNDEAGDWICNSSKSMGATNTGLDLPFGGCESERVPVTAYAEDCSGIEDFEDERSFSLFPNPAEERFFLNVSPGGTLQGRLRIRDLEGRILKDQQRSLESGRNSIDVAGFSKGIYMVNFQSKEGNFTKKLVIR